MADKKKIIAVLAGAVLALMLAEAGLRFAGLAAGGGCKLLETGGALKDSKAQKILCLGDSFTEGLGADKGFSYPEQLQRLLDGKFGAGKYAVIGGGISGCTSANLFWHMQEFIDDTAPSAAVVMVGMNDRWSLGESNYYLFGKGPKAYVFRVDSLLSGLRLYRLLKWYAINFYINSSIDKSVQPASGQVKPADPATLREYEKLKQAGKECYEQRDPEAIKLYERAGKLYSGDGNLHLCLAQCYR
jgi:hypothetical protein